MNVASPLKAARLARAGSLDLLAKKINELGRLYRDLKLDFCRSLVEAKERVESETSMTFYAWAWKNLRKPNGERWSAETLKGYLKCGRNPLRIIQERERQRNYSANRKEAIAFVRSHGAMSKNDKLTHDKVKFKTTPLSSVADEVNLLMTAWERASTAARKQFLKLINTTPNRS